MYAQYTQQMDMNRTMGGMSKRLEANRYNIISLQSIEYFMNGKYFKGQWTLT